MSAEGPPIEPLPSHVPNAREELKIRKLTLEIQQLQRPWYKQPAYLATLLPASLALVTLLVAAPYIRERLDAQSERIINETILLEQRRNALVSDVAKFEKRREELSERVTQLTATVNDVTSARDAAEQAVRDADKTIARRTTELSALRATTLAERRTKEELQVAVRALESTLVESRNQGTRLALETNELKAGNAALEEKIATLERLTQAFVKDAPALLSVSEQPGGTYEILGLNFGRPSVPTCLRHWPPSILV